MPSKETLKIQNHINELGIRLGFKSVIETKLDYSDMYGPTYDVIWFIDLTKYFNFKPLKPLFKNNIKQFDLFKNFPFAGFEIEGSNTTSKNQLSNFVNLYCGKFLYNFIIVDNKGAKNEEDTYRRGLKLHRYFTENSGDGNLFFLDKTQFYKSIESLDDFEDFINASDLNSCSRSAIGGEKISIKMYENIREYIDNTGFIIEQNYSPIISKLKYNMLKECKIQDDEYTYFYLRQKYYWTPYNEVIKYATKEKDNFYVPKLDLVLGFNAPVGFKMWLIEIAKNIKFDLINYPLLYGLKRNKIDNLFIPLIAFEIESSINKHLNGGIYNMSKNSYIGILVTNENSNSHIDYYKSKMGINNIISYCLGGEK